MKTINEIIAQLLESKRLALAVPSQEAVQIFCRGIANAITSLRLIRSEPDNITPGDTVLLNFMEMNLLEIDTGGPWIEESPFRIYEVIGNRNDREWRLRGEGATLREALLMAIRSYENDSLSDQV